MYDRMLDITPNDQGLIVFKAQIYQAEGDLKQSGRLLAPINADASDSTTFGAKISQLFLERHYNEAIQLLQTRRARFNYSSDFEKGDDQTTLAFAQELAGDSAGALASAKQGRDTLEMVCKERPEDPYAAASLAQAHATLDEKDAALKEAERAMTLLPSARDAVLGPKFEENLARILAQLDEKDRAIAVLQHLLKVPYGWIPITPALLRLDPVWDSLRGDPRFQKLCAEKQLIVLPVLLSAVDQTFLKGRGARSTSSLFRQTTPRQCLPQDQLPIL